MEERGWIMRLVDRAVARSARTENCVPHTDLDAMRSGIALVDEQIQCVGLRMTFDGDGHLPEIVGEEKLPGYHNYFLGRDESRWRTNVPLYGSVRYQSLYPRIDLRLREVDGVPEYDLLLRAGADLASVTVCVEGGQGMSIAGDGSLIIETALGPLIQPAPRTWELDANGQRREVHCGFTLLGRGRFGFAAPGWGGATRLTIDPGLVWSTYLGGSGNDTCDVVTVDAKGLVTVAGIASANFPTTTGAYNTTSNGNADAFISRLDPGKSGAAQLLYSTFLGGSDLDLVCALSVDDRGVVTVAGQTMSANLPTTTGAYDTAFNGVNDAFLGRLDPSRAGSNQLVYSTYLGGSGFEKPVALSVDARGVTTVTGFTLSADYPATTGAYDTSYNGGFDGFVSCVDPGRVGRAQLVYSTFLGGSSNDRPAALSVDAGVATVAGWTPSTDFPTSVGAYATTLRGSVDGFVCRVQLLPLGRAGLLYSSYLGGDNVDAVDALAVGAGGTMFVAGSTTSPNFPTRIGAYDRTYNGGGVDAFVCALDPSRSGAAQLVYSTFLGGANWDEAFALSVDASGVATVSGWTSSTRFPTTADAYDTTHNGGMDVFVSRLDPRAPGTAQLVHSTFLGGGRGGANDYPMELAVDESGVVTVAGFTDSTDFPTTVGAYDTTGNGNMEGFVSRLDMGVAFYGDVHEVSIRNGGTQKLTLNAGKRHAGRLYWIFGSVTGTRPGVTLAGVHVPLNPDVYTDLAMSAANSAIFRSFRGTLDLEGRAGASFKVPANLPVAAGFTFHHAYVVHDVSGGLYLASQPVPLRMR